MHLIVVYFEGQTIQYSGIQEIHKSNFKIFG
jgi:hypothetical protein